MGVRAIVKKKKSNSIFVFLSLFLSHSCSSEAQSSSIPYVSECLWWDFSETILNRQQDIFYQFLGYKY